MPSVRVRRSSAVFKQLEELAEVAAESAQGTSSSATAQQRRRPSIGSRQTSDAERLRTLFRRPDPVTEDSAQSNSEHFAETGEQILHPPHGAALPLSRVRDAISRATRRAQGERADETGVYGTHRNHRRSSSQRSIEGRQALLRTENQQPGVVESVISLTHSYDETANDHHEDDVVDHLDAIDPQIAVVSDLANAANSIVIPPLRIYSRKPVVLLRKKRRLSPEVLTETEQQKKKEEEGDDLDQHVEEVLDNKQRFWRTLKGIGNFVSTPIGFITALYGFLCAFWGAAIVLFLGKLINLHNPATQGFWVEISSQIENALFTVTGIGLIPWRIIDTYRILRIYHYQRLTKRLREEAGLPQLYDLQDLPDPIYDPNYVHVLSDRQQDELRYQQTEFMESQTWYRPHGTETHRAFPISWAIWICLLVDGNSIFQIILCGTMWGLDRFHRPAWSTGILIPASFLCGMAAGCLIWKGGQNTRRTSEVEQRLRTALELEHKTGLPAGLTAVATDQENGPMSQDEKKEGSSSAKRKDTLQVPADKHRN